METDAQYKFFDEIKRSKVLIIRDLYKPAVREGTNEYTGESVILKEEEAYIEYGECFIKGFPFTKPYFPFLLRLGMDFLQEVEANSYYQSVDYVRYLSDIRVTLETLLLEIFEDFHGLTRYKYFSDIVHVDFMNVDHHFQITDVDRESVIYNKVHEFSTKLQEILQEILERLIAICLANGLTGTSDNRIKCNARKEDIQSYFYQLMQNKKGEQILPKEEIDQFLHANFQCFEASTEKRLLNPIGLNEADIRYFIYDFLIKLEPNGKRQTYAKMCKENFVKFETSEIPSIASNFSKKPKKYFLD